MTAALIVSGFFVANSARAATTLYVSSDATSLTYRNVVVKAADRLVATQNTDGTWEFKNPDTNFATTNYPDENNTLGVTARGLVRAYLLTGKHDYLVAAKKTADLLVVKSPSGGGADTDTLHKTFAQDISFLIDFSQAYSRFGGDGSPYVNKATEYMNFMLNQPNRFCTAGCGGHADELVQTNFDRRQPNLFGWDIEGWVEAAVKTGNPIFAGQITLAMADKLAFVSATSTGANGGTGAYYALGLAGYLQSYALTGTDFSVVKSQLSTEKDVDGSFKIYDPVNDGIKQTTSYAITAFGAVDDRASILNSLNYLGSSQAENGGWIENDGAEYTETDSEIIQALYNGISGVDTYYTIQDAINAATSGDTINVTAGTYVENGQIVINKNLSIVGVDKTTTIIKPAQDTTNTSHADSAAWILVDSGKTFNLSNVTLNGNGKLIAIGILSHGHGTISNNVLTNIAYNQSGPDYKGVAIELYGSDMTVNNNNFSNIGRIGVFNGNGMNSTISGNTYTGKGAGDWLDYAFEVGRGSQSTITSNTISGNIGVATVDDSTSAGILVTSYFNPETPSVATITGNTISNSTDGIAVGYDANDASVVVAHNNKLSGNTTGINSTHPTVNATNNWWGAASGPSDIGAGSGDKVSANVNYRPWLLAEDGTAYDQTIALTSAGQWALVSVPKLLSVAPAIINDGVGDVTLLAYENGTWATPGVENTKPVSAFYVKTTHKGGVGFKYAVNGPANTSKQLTTGWNLVGTNRAGNSADNEFSSILDTPTTAGMVTLYVPGTYNSRKDVGGLSWEGDSEHDLNAKNPNNLQRNLSEYDGYWVFMNAAKAFVKQIGL